MCMDWRGYFFGREFVGKRACGVVVFVDVQNVHMDLRRAFVADADTAEPRIGAFNPWTLGERLVAKGPDFEDWHLVAVRAYAGSPLATRQPTAAAAHDRQIAQWEAWGVQPVARPLYYPPGWPTEKARQKGVDVALAVDVIRMAIDKEYQIGIVVSTDRDILPAIEAVAKLRKTEAIPRVCAVRYEGLPQRLNHTDDHGRTLHHFRLDVDDYMAVMDPTDYRIDPNVAPKA